MMVKQGEIKDSLKELKITIEKLEKIGRTDKRVVYDILSSEYLSLIKYFDSNPLPTIFKNKELTTLQINISEEIQNFQCLLKSYAGLQERKRKLDSDFDITEKSTVLFHHLEDLIEMMDMYLGFDLINKFEILCNSFDKRIEDLKQSKHDKDLSYQEKLMELKKRIREFDANSELLDEINTVIKDFEERGTIKREKVFLLSHRLLMQNIFYQKNQLQKEIILKVRGRLFQNHNNEIRNFSVEDFDSELDKIKVELKKD